MAARGKLCMFGVIFAGVGAYNLCSDVRHEIVGRPATATLMGRITQCTVEYQRIGEPERKEQWPCELAEEFERRAGVNKVKLSHDYIAHVQFQREDGGTQEADVDEVKLGSFRLAVGAALPVMYAPDDPTDVRPKMSWETLKVPLIMLAIGTPFLVLGSGIPLATLFGWVFRGRREETLSAAPEDLAPATPVSERRTYSHPAGTAPRTSFGMRNR